MGQTGNARRSARRTGVTARMRAPQPPSAPAPKARQSARRLAIFAPSPTSHFTPPPPPPTSIFVFIFLVSIYFLHLFLKSAFKNVRKEHLGLHFFQWAYISCIPFQIFSVSFY